MVSDVSQDRIWVWRQDTTENPDGTTTLVVTMYPLYYNSQTTDVLYYQNYTFEISHTFSAVVITSLATDKDAYEQGETLMVDVRLDNAGDPQDVVVDAKIRHYGTEAIVSGLLLSTLNGLQGPASFAPQWDSSTVAPGDYYIELTLQSPQGLALDRRTVVFRLGLSSGEILSFTATPEHFEVGDMIDLSLAFRNTGTVVISGTAVVQVKDAMDSTV